MPKLIPIIGMEVHVELNTASKMFCSCSNNPDETKPNTNICEICTAQPGTLPVPNKEAIISTVKISKALGATVRELSKFDRKHYFYPDLPKGYQISQLHYPLIIGGEVEIFVEGQNKKIGITRAHLEEDAGKNIHPEGKDYSLVDLNRAGSPLLEIVSEPDIKSPAEARAYVSELYLLMKFADVTEGDLYHGNMRFDVNVSVSKDVNILGNRSEIKNLNSFRSVEKAVEYEIKRQIDILKKGGTIKQETRGWDESKQRTFAQRTKEESHDYRYMPDPDIPPINLSDDFIKALRREMPSLMPSDWRSKLANLGVAPEQIELLLFSEAEFFGHSSPLDIISRTEGDKEFAKFTINFVINNLIPALKEGLVKLPKDQHFLLLDAIHDLVKAGKLNSTNAKELCLMLLQTDQLPDSVEGFANSKQLIQQSDSQVIDALVEEILKANPKVVSDIKAGEQKAIGFLVGQVMQQSKGQANPSLVQKTIRQKLDI